MNKILFFILLPVLAFLLNFSANGNDAILGRTTTGPGITTAAQQMNGTQTVNLTKDDTPKRKNNIRIKAWDHFSEIEATATWEPYTRIVYYNRAAYKAYQAYFLTAHFTKYNLRGPPSANA